MRGRNSRCSRRQDSSAARAVKSSPECFAAVSSVVLDAHASCGVVPRLTNIYYITRNGCLDAQELGLMDGLRKEGDRRPVARRLCPNLHTRTEREVCVVAMRQPSGSDHKKNDDLDNEEQDLDMLEFDGVLLQDRCAAPASPNLLATAAWPLLATWSDGVCAARRALEEIKSGLMSEGGDFCFGCAFVCCASVGMIFFILYFDLPV